MRRIVTRWLRCKVRSTISSTIRWPCIRNTPVAHYIPDITGNLVFNGVASDLFHSSFSTGIQADGSYRLNETHTLRMGMYGNSANIQSDNSSTV